MFRITAACVSDRGKKRLHNEDNFCFDGKYLPASNTGLEKSMALDCDTAAPVLLAVFDGMGGENYGELAAYSAARSCAAAADWLRGAEDIALWLNEAAYGLNAAVLAKAEEMVTGRMGCTLAELCLREGNYWVVNVGDSRVYLLRGGVLTQLSVDHCDAMLARRMPDGKKGKAPLTQYLGVSPEDFIIEPYIASGTLEAGDRFLICSDGITDMLEDSRIAAALRNGGGDTACAVTLLEEALAAGGKDNITAIVCTVHA